MDKTLNIYQKLHQVQAQTGQISRTELNKFQNYKYFTEQQALNILKPLLNEQQLTLTFSDTTGSNNDPAKAKDPDVTKDTEHLNRKADGKKETPEEIQQKSQAQILQNALDLANQAPNSLTNQQLLRILGERIARREIEYLNPFLFIKNEGQTANLKKTLNLLEDQTIKGKYDEFDQPLTEPGLASLMDDYESEDEEDE
ncbi:14042_t:CDS:2 [Funneliformis geosporum]|uniref:14042_t:CDS:1 n=1 Tax=Funneliformis geosporum TaxID=1117311 RepID=A0A9W4WY03_9GLOM|nr:14042_t:CDS:2 [Funneliformis geosporum]